MQAQKPHPTLFLLLSQFKSPIILISIFSARLSLFLHDTVDAVIILAIVLISGLLGFWQERGAADAVQKLLLMVQVKATVHRDGKPADVPTQEVVSGDLVMLYAGDIVPADCLILESKDLFVNEAALTGETFPVEKTAGGLIPVDGTLLSPWAFPVAAYARRLVRPEQGDMRLRRLWEEVGVDLAQPWTVEALAARVGVSGEHLRRLCQRHLSRSLMSHVVSLRMRQAMALLTSDFCTIETVAQKVGYDNPFAFRTAYNRHQEISPLEYRLTANASSALRSDESRS